MEAMRVRSKRYEVTKSKQYVTITIDKQTSEDFTFWVRTIDGTAKAGEDYEEINELFTMQAEETERQIKIGIKNNPQWQQDKTFKVQLLDEFTQARLPGNATESEVLIVDDVRDLSENNSWKGIYGRIRINDQGNYYLGDRKTVMVLGTLGIGKSTVLNKLSQTESEPFQAIM